MNILELLAYNSWAEDHYLTIISRLTEDQFKQEISGKSIHDLLYHLLEVYWFWLRRITNQDFTNEPAKKWNKNDIIQALRNIRVEISDFAKNEDLQNKITIQWDDNDKQANLSYNSVLMNFIVHSGYHRGQHAILLKSHGVAKIGDTDINPYNYQLEQRI